MQYLIIIILFFIAGCSSDIEKTEVTGLCRSCAPYWVRGGYYEPQRFYEYHEHGKASWYGPGFHKKKGAGSDVFNQHELTAAHRTLPLPAVVRVTNLKTNKHVDLVVNDRGPYTYEGRIIDLSEKAAKIIGSHKKGLANVKVQTLVQESKALSDYLKKHGAKGRSWRSIYDEKIAGKFDDIPYEED